MADDLTGIANELYSLAPQEFTAARNARAMGTRSNKELAASIRHLPKPSASAWVINMLVRHHTDQIEQVLELGASLRAAQDDLDRDALTQLTGQRRQLLAALTRQATELAESLGHRVTASAANEVEQTLQAALTDPDAAAAMQSGRLVKSLATVGFEPVDLTDAVAGGGSGTRDPPSHGGSAQSRDDLADRRERRLETPRQEAEEADRHADEAIAELDELNARTDDATTRRDELASELEGLREQVADAENDLTAAERDSRALDRERDKAKRAVEQAKREVERARERRDRLS